MIGLRRSAMAILAFFLLLSAVPLFAGDDDDVAGSPIPNTGQTITPLAPRNAAFQTLNPGLADAPNYLAGQAVTSITSPDRHTLLVLTSGYNLYNYPSGPNQGNTEPADSTEYVFIYDITNDVPVQKQVIQVPNTYNGMVFDPSGKTFYVSGGVDDNVHIYDRAASGSWAERAGSPVKLGHAAGNGLGLPLQPEAAGVAISADGTTLVVANYYNDSVSILKNSASGWAVSYDLDLRPGKINAANSGVPGGEYPFWVVINGSEAYVSSIRDREIDVVNLSGTPALTARIAVNGQPNKMALDVYGRNLYVAMDESDSIAVINTATNTLAYQCFVGVPKGLVPSAVAQSTGHNTNSVTISRDGTQLFVTNGNSNDVAVVQLNGELSTVVGLIPTGWYPNSVSFSADGTYMYVVNGKSPTGPNPGYCDGAILPNLSTAACNGSNQYDLQLIKAGLQSMPIPTGRQLSTLTSQVIANNNFRRVPSASAQSVMAAVRSKIQHVIYIIKENRTYDQILGDAPTGNGDPALAEFGQATTPNLHSLAANFVNLDNFYDRSEVSMDGWPWSTSARAPDVVERQVTVNYANRGLTNDSEGTNRNINISYPTLLERLQANPLTPRDPDLLPGTVDTSAPDGPGGVPNEGYLWNGALRAGLTIRNYGFFIDLVLYNLPGPYAAYGIPELTNPFATNTTVAYSTNADLRPFTDPYFRGFDNSFPDYYRYTEWARDFDANYATGGLPALSFVRLMHDHTGNFSTAIAGVNTPELQEADNDYAVGLLVQKVASSIYANNTLIFVIEDDSQAGGDHVDAHRSIAFIVGPYVKRQKVVSTACNTVDFVRTIEEVLGLQPLNLNDTLAIPMADVFDLNQTTWSYTATPSAMLRATTLPITFKAASAAYPHPRHDSAYWAKVTEGMDFSSEDKIDSNKYNRILWEGVMGDKPYPAAPTGKNLRKNRARLLAAYRKSQPAAAASH